MMTMMMMKMMKANALVVSLVAVVGCKSGEKSAGAPPTPTPTAAPAPDVEPEVKDEAPPAASEPANTLVVGATVRKPWDEGGPGEVVWKVEGGGLVTLQAEPGEPEGVLSATYQNRKQHLTNFACDTARGGSDAAFALTPEGKVLFRSAVGPAGKDPGDAVVFLLEWKPDKGKVFVAKSWNGTDVAEPPPWARL